MRANTSLRKGALLMVISGVAFIGYGVVFLIWNFTTTGFELGVDTLNGVTRGDLDTLDPAITNYISHLHVATAAFIISTGVAVTGLTWFGVREGELWAWTTALIAAVIGLAVALPMHWLDLFGYDWVAHLGPIYLAAIVFVVGAVWALMGIRAAEPSNIDRPAAVG